MAELLTPVPPTVDATKPLLISDPAILLLVKVVVLLGVTFTLPLSSMPPFASPMMLCPLVVAPPDPVKYAVSVP